VLIASRIFAFYVLPRFFCVGRDNYRRRKPAVGSPSSH
jgi:hypothetical protein